MKLKEAREKGYIEDEYTLDNGFVHSGDITHCPYCENKVKRKNIYSEGYFEVEYDYYCENCNKTLGHYAYGNYEYDFVDMEEEICT